MFLTLGLPEKSSELGTVPALHTPSSCVYGISHEYRVDENQRPCDS